MTKNIVNFFCLMCYENMCYVIVLFLNSEKLFLPGITLLKSPGKLTNLMQKNYENVKRNFVAKKIKRRNLQ